MVPEDMPDLILTEWVVLALICEEPRHGFSIARELKEGGAIGQVWTVHRPLVYRAIDRLNSVALIEPVGIEPGDKGPSRTIYRATDHGAGTIRWWLQRPVEHPREVRTELMLKLILLARIEESTFQLIERQTERFHSITSGLKDKVARSEGPDHLVAIWRLESMEAIRRLFDALVREDVAKHGGRRPR